MPPVQEDSLSGHLYVFTNREKPRTKLLYFDGSRAWVGAERLGEGCFGWPKTGAPGAQWIVPRT